MEHNRPQKKLRLPRVEKNEGQLLQAEDSSHLWAVSYADFLMVLLSFFVIFFSVDKNNKPNLIHNIITQIKKDDSSIQSNNKSGSALNNNSVSSAKNANGDHSASSSVENELTSSSNIETKDKADSSQSREIASEKKSTGLPVSLDDQITALYKDKLQRFKVDQDKIVINFPDSIFNVGKFDMNLETQSEFKKLLKLLEPYKNEIILGFIGHSDTVPVRKIAGRDVENNIDISVMRASRAMNQALTYGFSSSHLFASGVGSDSRNTRSLSVIIKSYQGGLL